MEDETSFGDNRNPIKSDNNSSRFYDSRRKIN